MKKIFLCFYLIVIFSFKAFASSQIVALIGEEVITKNNLQDRYKFFLVENPHLKITSKQEKDFILKSLLKAIIDEKILLQELEKKNIKVSQEEVNQGVAYLEETQKIPKGKFFQHIKKKGLSKEYAISQIKRSILWEKFLSEYIAPTVEVSNKEVYESMAYSSPESLQVEYLLVSGNDKLALAKQVGKIKNCNDKSNERIANLQKIDATLDKILDPNLRKAVISSEQGHPSYMFDYNGGYAFAFICEKKSSKDSNYFTNIMLQIRQAKIDKQAEYYLQNLAKTKFIEIKEVD